MIPGIHLNGDKKKGEVVFLNESDLNINQQEMGAEYFVLALLQFLIDFVD